MERPCIILRERISVSSLKKGTWTTKIITYCFISKQKGKGRGRKVYQSEEQYNSVRNRNKKLSEVAKVKKWKFEMIYKVMRAEQKKTCKTKAILERVKYVIEK